MRLTRNRRALLVADMPFMTYQIHRRMRCVYAARLLTEGKAGAVKIEGGTDIAPHGQENSECRYSRVRSPGLHAAISSFAGRAAHPGREPADAVAMVADAKALSWRARSQSCWSSFRPCVRRDLFTGSASDSSEWFGAAVRWRDFRSSTTSWTLTPTSCPATPPVSECCTGHITAARQLSWTM